MGNPISNFISKFAKTPKRSIGKREIGSTGTKIFSGIIDEEFNPNLRSLEAVKVYDRMRKSDAQVFSSLQAVKLPLLSATWYIEPAKGDDINETEAQDQADFITKNLFEDLKWNRQLKRILTYLDFGFKYLEKVFGIDEEGKIVWIKWGDRQQNAHYAWENDNGKKGALQQLPTCNEDNYNPFTPMEKLLVFSYQKEGDNYDGVSVLRTAYKHWWYKDNLYKIQGISAERYGVGVPWIKLGESVTEDDRNDAIGMAQNVRSNETAYFVTPNDWEIDILTPKGSPLASTIENAIAHHNRMILMNVLAPFLDLGSGSTGSFALSKDQSSFFILGLKAIVDDISDVVNEAIKELILYNWPDTKVFPTLEATDLSATDIAAFATAMNTLTTAGYLLPDEELMKYTRDVMNLPELPDDFVMPEPEEEVIEEVIDKEKVGEEEDEEVVGVKKIKKKVMTDMDKIDIKNKIMSSVKLPSREKSFLKAIDENEVIISNRYKEFETCLENTEKQIKKFLLNKIDRADTKMVNGVEVLKQQFKLSNDIKSGVTDIMKKFKLKVSGGTLSMKMMKEVAKLSIVTSSNLKNSKEFAVGLLIAEPQIRSFMAGHISNLDAVVFNEGRHVIENMHDNIMQEVSIRLTKEQISKIKFNRNIYKLSVTAHPRGLFRNIITEDARNQGINNFKLVVPPSRWKELNPSGITAGLLFAILTAQQWNEKTGIKNNIDTIGGLGVHHGSFEYAFPVDEDRLEEEKKLAREQRSEFLKYLIALEVARRAIKEE